MSCKVFRSSETNMLGFLYTKGIIDESRQVLNRKLADFYLQNFNRQIARAQLSGSAYLIKNNVLIPNSEVLKQLDPQTDTPTATNNEFGDNYRVEEKLEATSQANQWDSSMEADLQQQYGSGVTSLLKNMTQRGFIETRCSS